MLTITKMLPKLLIPNGKNPPPLASAAKYKAHSQFLATNLKTYIHF